MWDQNRITEVLGIRHPIIQAGMAGKATNPKLVAAVSNAGGLGTLGAGYLTPAQIGEAIDEIRKQTSQPFAVNLLIPSEMTEESAKKVENAMSRMEPFRKELGLSRPNPEKIRGESFEEQVAVLIEKKVPVFSFTFDVPEIAVLSKLKENGTLLAGTATTVREALYLEDLGIDVIVAQGSEAGGHRGTFLGPYEQGMVGTLALVPQMVDKVKVPVIAAGGIMDGRGIVAALALGAEGVQMGTAFLTVEESDAHPEHRRAILNSHDESTAVTRAFSGKPARGIRNRFMTGMESFQKELPDYPVQNLLTGDIRKEAASQNNPDYLSMWAGQASRLSRVQTAKELMENLVRETEEVLTKFQWNSPYPAEPVKTGSAWGGGAPT